jgi:hypothetical protein
MNSKKSWTMNFKKSWDIDFQKLLLAQAEGGGAYYMIFYSKKETVLNYCAGAVWLNSSVPQILDHPVSLRLLERRLQQFPNHLKGIWKGLRLTCVSYVKRRPEYSAGAVWMNGSVPQILDHPVSLCLLERRHQQFPNHLKGIWKGLRLTCVSYVKRRPAEYSAGAVWMNGSVPQILDHPVSLRLLGRRHQQYPNHFKGIWKGLRLTLFSYVKRRPAEYSAGAVWMNSSVLQILDHPVSLRLLERRHQQYPNHFKDIWKGIRLTCVSYVKRRPGYSAGAVWMNGSVPQILDHPVSLRLLERRLHQFPNHFNKGTRNY